LRNTLPKGNQGTLEDRLYGVKLRAKTGTLDNISVLSGWVWLKRRDRWCAFSIMSGGMTKTVAAGIEDRIVRILSSAAR
jgi:D-alanyl-D-alanine carboxypeptidase